MTTPVFRIVERDMVVFRRLWHGVVFSSFVQPLLFLLAMGVGVGGYVDDRGSALGGLSYLQFVTPGLLAATVFQLAIADSLWGVMGGTKWERRYHPMVSAPLRPAEVLLAHLVWQAMRSTMAAVPFLFVALVLGGLRSPWALLGIPAAALLVVAVASVVATWSTTVEDEQTFPLVMRFGVMPLFLFSGTFFPTSNLPAWLRHAAPVSPLYHGVELCRAATVGHARSAGAVVVHVAVLAATAGVGVVLGRRSYSRRLTP